MLTFKSFVENRRNMIIYCDMDGVLADFVKFANEKSESGEFTDNDWDALPINTYSLLDPMPDASKLFSYISKYDLRILTAYPSAKRGAISKAASEDKIGWMKRVFNFPREKIHTVLRKDKKEFAQKNAILIDDDKQNIEEFIAFGGIGIRHTSAERTINQLKKMSL